MQRMAARSLALGALLVLAAVVNAEASAPRVIMTEDFGYPG